MDHNRNRRTLAATFIAAALAATFAAPAAGQEPRTLKMQSSWPASLIIHDNFRLIADRVDKLTGGSLKIETLAAGLDVTPKDIMGMGLGGLLKEIPTRPQPREGGSTVASSPRIAALILAWLILGQGMAPRQIVGALIVVGAVVLIGVKRH